MSAGVWAITQPWKVSKAFRWPLLQRCRLSLDPTFASVTLSSSDFHRQQASGGFGCEFDCEPALPTGFRTRSRVSTDGAFAFPLIPLRVAKVDPGGPAQRAGLRPGDVVTHLDGKPVTADSGASLYGEFALEVFDPANPQKHRLTVLREGRKEPFDVAFGQGPYDPESVFGVRRNESNEWDLWLDKSAGIAYRVHRDRCAHARSNWSALPR